MSKVSFENADELLKHMQNGAWWAIGVAADGWPYILSCDEDGEFFAQGLPFEDDSDERKNHEDWVDRNNEWLEQKSESWFPFTLLGDSESGGSSNG